MKCSTCNGEGIIITEMEITDNKTTLILKRTLTCLSCKGFGEIKTR